MFVGPSLRCEVSLYETLSVWIAVQNRCEAVLQCVCQRDRIFDWQRTDKRSKTNSCQQPLCVSTAQFWIQSRSFVKHSKHTGQQLCWYELIPTHKPLFGQLSEKQQAFPKLCTSEKIRSFLTQGWWTANRWRKAHHHHSTTANTPPPPPTLTQTTARKVSNLHTTRKFCTHPKQFPLRRAYRPTAGRPLRSNQLFLFFFIRRTNVCR